MMVYFFIPSQTRFKLNQTETWKNKNGGSHAEILVLPVALRSSLYGAKTLRGVAGSNPVSRCHKVKRIS
jgi:hypothetical protein